MGIAVTEGRIQPIGTGVLVRREKPDDKTEGGLHIPGESIERSQFATVIAVGSKVCDVDTSIRPGAVVMVVPEVDQQVTKDALDGTPGLEIYDASMILAVIDTPRSGR